MNFLKIFIIISLIISTMWVLSTKPANHKHFIVASSNFKLQKNTQKPEDLQSTILFKVGNTQINTSKTANTTMETSISETVVRENKIIPSTILSQPQTTQSSIVNNTVSQQVNGTLNNSQLLDREISEQQSTNIHDKFKTSQKDNSSETYSHTTLRNNSSGNGYSGLQDKNYRYRNETIAWNSWRSNLQNRIMDDSNVSAGLGTIFFFSFVVDKDRNISKVKVVSTDFTNTNAINSVKDAILNLEGEDILEFPQNTNRNKVNFSGGFFMGYIPNYASPDNYNDYENIRVRY